jgi:hypothetical protein
MSTRSTSVHVVVFIALVAPLAAARGATAQPRKEAAHAHDPEPKSQAIYVDAEAGAQQVNLRTFTANADSFTAGLVPTVAVGPAFGAGAGLRIIFLTFGARARIASFESLSVGAWSLATLDGEVGFRAPLGDFEPSISASFGYASVGGLATAVPGLPDVLTVHGVNGRVGLGFDYWVARNVSIGARGTFDLLVLSRPGVPLDELARATQAGTLNEAKADVLRANGSSAGTALGLTGGLGIHF